MKAKQAKAAQRIAELERQLLEARAGQAHVYYTAEGSLDAAGMDRLKGSGVVLTLSGLGGAEICKPVLIRDGLSAETIAALKRDIARSFIEATAFKPKGVLA